MPICSRVWCALLLCSGPALADTYTVTKVGDTLDGACNADCSLREAIQAANQRPGADVIVLQDLTYRLQRATPFPPEQDDNVTVDEDGNATGDFDVQDSLLIRGRGASAIDGNYLDRVLDVLPGATVELRDVEIKRGRVRERGAGIANAGTLRLVRVKLRANVAASAFNLGQGGGLFNSGTLSIADSRLLYNDAGGGEASLGEGGGIYNTGRLNIRATSFIGNTTHDDNDIGGGGAIMNRGGYVTIQRAFFGANASQLHGYGGAVANRSGGRMEIVNATVSGNTSGEAADGGGAIANGTRHGDAGRLTLSYVTVVDNDGGGLFNAGELTYYDSIIAGNYENYSSETRNYAAGVNCVSLSFPITAGAIVALDGDGCRGQTYVDNASTLSQVVHPLANNGGFAPTHALREFEPALDAASYGLGCPATDQRGAPRPADGNADGVATCDIGAFERNDDD